MAAGTVVKSLLIAFVFLAGSAGAAAPDCGLDLFSLRVDRGNVTYSLQNTGTTPANVSFQAATNGEFLFSGNTSLNPRQTTLVGNNLTVGPGVYTVEASAQSSCGATDRETIVHTILPKPSCTSPLAQEGQDRCELSSQSYFSCEGGEWVLKARNTDTYCYACGLSTCGDGVLNCGETEATCPRDARRVACQKGYGRFRCSGSTLQQEYTDSFCKTSYLTVQKCADGCEQDACSGTAGCSIAFPIFDYTTNIPPGTTGAATFILTNTGPATTVSLSLLVDGQPIQTHPVALFAGQEYKRTLTYLASPGPHTVAVQAQAACGTVASRTATVHFQGPGTLLPIQVFTPAPSVATSVTAVPLSFDLFIDEARGLAITITSSRPQNFSISAIGFPDEWMQARPDLVVNRKETVHLTFFGKAAGLHKGMLVVFAQSEKKTFTFPLEFFVFQPVRFTGSFLWSGVDLAVAVAGLIIIFILYAYRDDIRFKMLELKWRRVLSGQRIRRF